MTAKLTNRNTQHVWYLSFTSHASETDIIHSMSEIVRCSFISSSIRIIYCNIVNHVTIKTMTRSQLAHVESLNSYEREELEDLFSFTAPALEFTSTAAFSENITQFTTLAGCELDDLYDFDNQVGYSSIPESLITVSKNGMESEALPLLDPMISWDSIFNEGNTKNHDDTQCISLDNDTIQLLEWLEKTHKPSNYQARNLGDGVEIYRLLENEIHQIFDLVSGGDKTEKMMVAGSSAASQALTENRSVEYNYTDFCGKENGSLRNRSTFIPACEDGVTSTDDKLWSAFAQAVRSIETTIAKDIRPLLLQSERRADHKHFLSVLTIPPQDRPHLWTKVLCSNKTIQEVLQSSLVDSFIHFQKGFDFQAFVQKHRREDQDSDTNLSSTGISLSQRILEEATTLAPYVLLDIEKLKTNNNIDGENADTDISVTEDSLRRNLCSLLYFYYQNDSMSKVSITDPNASKNNTWNALIGPVSATLLSASIPLEVISVMASTIGPVAMPLIALTNEERKPALTRLHRYFYLLVRYHIPTCILHLDRNAPGWYLPIADEDTSTIPVTWFSSLLAGECMNNQAPKTLALDMLRRYWDASFLSQDNSFKFYLAAVLFQVHADTLLTLQGPDLVKEITLIMTLQRSSPFSVMIQWFLEAKLLQETTPRSFQEVLREAENDVVKSAIMLRQRKLLDKEEKDEAERRKQVEIARIQKEEEAQVRMYLFSFYEKHAPDKVSTVDNILKVYSGRIPLLNQRLTEKYGVGFLPISVPKPAAITAIKSLKQSIQQGLKSIQERDVGKESMSSTQDVYFSDSNVALLTSPNEVISSLLSDEISSLIPYPQNIDTTLPYCIIDSRPDDIASLQGRFHKTFALSPETLSDPLLMKDLRRELEILRGDRHICIMVNYNISFFKGSGCLKE